MPVAAIIPVFPSIVHIPALNGDRHCVEVSTAVVPTMRGAVSVLFTSGFFLVSKEGGGGATF